MKKEKWFGVNMDKNTGVLLSSNKPFYEVWVLSGIYFVEQLRNTRGNLIEKWAVCCYPRLNFLKRILVLGLDKFGREKYLSYFPSYNEAVKEIGNILSSMSVSLKYPIGEG